jgi:hypothetical protein
VQIALGIGFGQAKLDLIMGFQEEIGIFATFVMKSRTFCKNQNVVREAI